METAAPASQELPSAPPSEAAIAETAASGNTLAPVSHNEPVAEYRSEAHPEEDQPREDSEALKNTAAAWASWRQIRDTGDSKTETAEPARAESAAMAVAAGAEQTLQEATASPENPQDVASIVDSVLADLRPRLMAEITRKMSEKK